MNLFNFFIRKFFFWICLEMIDMMEGHVNLLNVILMLDGHKNHKDATFDRKIDLNKFPQNLLNWHENEKFDKIVIVFLKTYE